MADRRAIFAPGLNLKQPLSEAELFAQLRRLYYDLAGAPVPRLLSFADPTHLLYGSDYPFTPEALVVKLLNQLEAAGISPENLRLFMRENAVALLPRRAVPWLTLIISTEYLIKVSVLTAFCHAAGREGGGRFE